MASCSPEGNKGLPIILQGPITAQSLNSIQSSSFIELKASIRTTFPSYDTGFVFHESSQTTIRGFGETFTLQHAQLFKTTNRSYYASTQQPIAEFALFFKAPTLQRIVLFIPVFEAAKLNVGGNYIASALTRNTAYKGSISQIVGNKSIHYETCIPCKKPSDSLKVNVFVLQDGIQLDANTAKALTQAGTLKEFGIPTSVLASPDALTVMIPGTSSPTYDTSGAALRKVYTTLVSTSSDNFTKRFRFYEKTFLQSTDDQQKEKKASTAYKCVPVDTRKNLKKVGDTFVVSLEKDDLDGAQTLQDVVDQQQQGPQGSQTQQQGEDTLSQVSSYVALAIGTSVGAALASGALWLGFRYLVRK